MNVRQNALTLAITLVLATGTLPLTTPSAKAQDTPDHLSATCPVPADSTQSPERPPFLAAVPEGVALTALAHHLAQQLPEGAEFELVLDQLALPEESAINDRRTAGPTLFLVQGGTVAVIDNGRARHAAGEEGLASGESVLVERNRLVDLENAGSGQAVALVFGVLPPEGRLPIGAFGEPAVIWIPIRSEGEQHEYRQMALGAIGALAHEETLLFAACLHWSDPAAAIAPTSFPGPVGVLVLRGQAMINGAHAVGAGGCWLAPPFTPLSIAAGEAGTDAVLFGAWKSSAQPNPADAVSADAPSLDCEGPSGEDAG
jgi:hypothetical protein